MAFDRKKFIGKFVEEAQEHLAKLNDGFLALEKNSDDTETLNEVFRSAHTIKGTSHILSLTGVSELAHKLEDTLGALRDKKIPASKKLFNVLFKATDTLAEMTELIRLERPITMDVTDVCEQLVHASSRNLRLENLEGKCGDESRSSVTPRGRAQEENETPANFLDDSTKQLDVESEIQNAPMAREGSEQSDDSSKFEEDKGTMSEYRHVASRKSGSDTIRLPNSYQNRTIRINVDKIDKIVKLAGEIISIHGRMHQNLGEIEKFEKRFLQHTKFVSRVGNSGKNSEDLSQEEAIPELARELSVEVKKIATETKEALNLHALLTKDLRDEALGMRMMPLSTVLDTFPRMVRDLSASQGKEVTLIIEGGETELDKKIIEKIGDPLVHIIRNCFDHGLEQPGERIRLGKPEKGTIRISSCYEGGNVLIKVGDDGRGIAISKIKERALKKNLFDKKTLDSLSKREITNFIFRPGFSTSAIITDISGRGVGMDVVRENIVENLKGAIQIESTEGQGTQFLIRLPLTLAIMPVLLVSASNLKFAIAVNSVDEIVRIPKDAIINVVDKRAIRHHEQIIPVVRLATVLQLPEQTEKGGEEELIVLVYMGSEKLGLIVDSLLKEDNVEIMPLPPKLEHIDSVAGATLLGKDEIVTLLNVTRILALAKEIKDSTSRVKTHSDKKKVCTILVVDDSVNTREIEKSILESYGYKVDLASDGLEGFTKAKAFKYDLIVTDIEMPRLDGFSLTEKLREDKDYQSTPIIIVTSRDQDDDKRRGIQVGADAYIVKGSFDESNLLNTVQSLIG